MNLSPTYPSSSQLTGFILITPLIVLGISRIGVELSTLLLPIHISWLLAFVAYYLSISLVWWIALKKFDIKATELFQISFAKKPSITLFIFTILVPALMPLGVFLTTGQDVPAVYWIYIVIFSLINPIFEEGYWRGLLLALPLSNWSRLLFSASGFAFSHYFLWAPWFKSPFVIIPTVVSTFIMGLLWMHFMHKKRNLLYPYLSHVVVDILNLSIAIYAGVVTPY